MRIRNLKPYKVKKAIYERDDELNDILVGYGKVMHIQADIQPCKGQEKTQLYGAEITKYLTVICHPQQGIEEGLYIEVEGKQYKISPIEKWRTHWTFDMRVVI